MTAFFLVAPVFEEEACDFVLVFLLPLEAELAFGAAVVLVVVALAFFACVDSVDALLAAGFSEDFFEPLRLGNRSFAEESISKIRLRTRGEKGEFA